MSARYNLPVIATNRPQVTTPIATHITAVS